MNKKSQKEICLLILENEEDRFIPAHEFVGEKMIDGDWHFLSYKAPARLSDLMNDGLVERELVTGRSGAKYYAYRLVRNSLKQLTLT